jgi:hypothetical protein
MSSLSFLGNATSYLRIPNNDGFDFGTGNFTIEWYQYQTDSNSFPRIFQVGSYEGNISIGVSIEGGTFYYWTNGSANSVINLDSSDYKNIWVHFAISRSNGTTKIFMDGSSIFSMNDTNNFNGANDLIVGNESDPSNIAAFGGYITYFSWVKGIAVYTSNFTVSNDYPTLTNDSVLLLKVSSFLGTLGNTVENNNVGTIQNVPPNFSSIIPTEYTQVTPVNPVTVTPVTRPNLRNLKSLFTDNSLVFYKPGSLASCGVGSVRNSSTKSRKI